jgi:hypothetical protein
LSFLSTLCAHNLTMLLVHLEDARRNLETTFGFLDAIAARHA